MNTRQVMYGPIHFVSVAFEDEDVVPGLIKELDLVREEGIIRLVDFLFVSKDELGAETILDVSDYTREEKIEFGAAVGALLGYGIAGIDGLETGAIFGAASMAENNFGLLKEDMREVLDKLPPGTSACFILFEHTWAKRIKQYMFDRGGVLLSQGIVSPDALVEIGAQLGAAIQAEQLREQEEYEIEQRMSQKVSSRAKPKSRKPKTSRQVEKTNTHRSAAIRKPRAKK